MKSAAVLVVLSLFAAVCPACLSSAGLFIEGNSTGGPFLLTSRNGFLFEDSY